MSDDYSEVGQVAAVEVEEAGGNAVGDHPVGTTTIQLDDASDFPEIEAQARLGDIVIDVSAVDADTDVITLAAPSPAAVEDGERIFVHPSAPTTWAHVIVDPEEPALQVEVPFGIKAFTGLEPGDLVRFTESSQTGALRLVEVIGADPTLHASRVDDAEQLLLADQQTLGEKLTKAAADLEAARTRLTAAEQRLNDAFSEIDLLPDDAYVQAAKQQAIDAAAVTAQQKADAAKAAAIADAQGKLTTARSQLETAIASGDSATIAAAEQKVLTARAEAIAAAAQDATAKAAQAKADAIAAAALDATSKATEALTRANEALTAADAAQATADNAIRTYYSATPPWPDGSAQPDDVLGDMWYDDDSGQAYRWNGATWVVIVDQTIGEALAAAQSAQTTADGKITAFYQNAAPLEADEGDLWFDLDDNNKVYRRTSSGWVSVSDARIAAQATALANLQEDLSGLEGTLDGKSNVWVQASAPTGLGATDKGDIWINDGATPRTTKVWNGTTWVDADSRITQAVADITKKITTYYTATTTAPTGTFVDGDLWIDVNGKIARRNGTSWVTVSDPKAYADAARTAASAHADQQIANRTNLVDNPSRTGELGRWVLANGGYGSATESLTLVDRTFDGATIKVAEHWAVNHSQVYSSGQSGQFAVDPAKAYQVSVWLEDEKAITNPSLNQIYFGIHLLKSDRSSMSPLTSVSVASGVGVPGGTNFYFMGVNAASAPIGGFRRYVGYIMPNGTDPSKMKNLGLNVAANAISGPDTAFGRVRVYNYQNQGTPRKIWFAHPTVVEVDPMAVTARQEAIEAAAADAKTKADAAEENAKAFATTRTDGLAKTLWSTALPGTTTAPQNSVWYQHDAQQRIIAVFTQTGAGTAAQWVARPITSEAIDNLDVGKLTAAQGTVNDLVANVFAAKLADLIEANIGNLTVTGDAHLNEVVAERIWSDVASFARITADQVLAGNIEAVWSIATGGKIIAGDPDGARVEMGPDGIRVFALGFNGQPYEAVSMVAGQTSFAVVDQTRGVIAGISSAGDVTGQAASFAKGVTVRGTDLTGQLGGGTVPGLLDVLPRGIVPGGLRYVTTAGTAASGEVISTTLRVTLERGRLYRVVAKFTGRVSTSTGVIRLRLRRTLDTGARPTTSSPIFGDEPLLVGYNSSVSVSGSCEAIFTRSTRTDMVVSLTYQGLNGSTAQREWTQIYVEDLGLRSVDFGGGDDDTPKTTYTTAWAATASRGYAKTGATIGGKENKLSLWYFGTSTAESAAVLFGGTATTFDNASESGRTIPQALNGATIHSVELELTNAMWWNKSIRNLGVNTLGGNTLPSTKVVEGAAFKGDIPEGGTVRIPLDPAWFLNGTNTGVTIGDKDGSMSVSGATYQMGAGELHGPADPNPPRLIVTYSR